MSGKYRFNRMELAGSLGDLGTILPLAIGMILINLIPMSVLGPLLVFAGAQLSLTLLDMKSRKELFIPLLVVGITLATNLAVGFFTGIAIAYLLKWERLSI